MAFAIQKLVDNNHPWSSIKWYSLSEIGVFLNVIVRQEEDKRAERLSDGWISANVTQEGLMKVIKGTQVHNTPRKVTVQQEDPDEVEKNWKDISVALGRMR